MSIQVRCTCGTTLKVREQLAGKRVKCPKCDAVVQVEKSNSIRVTCSCGQLLNAKRSLAGKQVLCPACRQPLSIPGATEEPPNALDTGFDSALSDALAADPPPAIQAAGGSDYWKHSASAPVTTRETKKTNRKKTKGVVQDPLVIVTGVFCILFGLGHVGILLRTFLRLGVEHFASLGGVFSLVQPTLSIGILAVGIGLLAKQDWATELGPPVAYGYLFLLGLSAILMLFAAALLGVGGLIAFIIALPILGIYAIVPYLLLHVCQHK